MRFENLTRLLWILAAPVAILACSGTTPIVSPEQVSAGSRVLPSRSDIVQTYDEPPVTLVDGSELNSTNTLPETLAQAPSSFSEAKQGLRKPAISPLPSDINPWERRIAILSDAVAALRREISTGYQQRDSLKTEANALREEVSGLRKKLASSRGENDRLIQDLRQLERKLREINNTPSDTNHAKEPTDQERDNVALLDRIQELEEQLVTNMTSSVELESLRKELEEALAQNAQLEIKIATIPEHIITPDSSATMVTTLQERLLSRQADVIDLQTKVQVLEQELIAASSEKMDLETARRELAVRQQDNAVLESRIERRIEELEQLFERYELYE